MAPEPLFAGKPIGESLRSREAELKETVDRLPVNQLVDTSVSDLIEALVDEHGVGELVIHEDRIELSSDESKVRVRADPILAMPSGKGTLTVDGFRIELYLPFDGELWLFRMRPSRYNPFNFPTGTIRSSEVVLSWEGHKSDEAQMKAHFDEQLAMIRNSVQSLNVDTSAWMSRLPDLAQQAIALRRQRLDELKSLESAMGLPVRRRGSAPPAVPARRKRLGLKRLHDRNRTDRSRGPEWMIEQSLYEDIIDIIQAMGRAFERTPGSFAKFGEEGLRDHILLQLNGTFEGRAGGELFNGSGKTDILVRVEDHTVFVGECKMWHGERACAEAIDQLLGYLVWHDTKAALVLFITQQSVAAIIEKADGTFRNHANFVRDGSVSPDSSSRRNYVLHNRDDANKHIQVALIPVPIHDS